MATDTITVVYNWLRTSYLLHLDVDIGLVTTSGSNHALRNALCGASHAQLGGRAGGRWGWVRYIYIQIHRLGKFSVNHRGNCHYIHAQVLCNCLKNRQLYCIWYHVFKKSGTSLFSALDKPPEIWYNYPYN